MALVVPVLLFLPLAVTNRTNSPLRPVFAAGVVLAVIPPVIALAPQAGVGLVVSPSLTTQYVPWCLAVAAVGAVAYTQGDRLVADAVDVESAGSVSEE